LPVQPGKKNINITQKRKIQAISEKYSNSNFDTPRLLHLYDGGGPPLERGFSQKADY
jgi:hypothetical protein